MMMMMMMMMTLNMCCSWQESTIERRHLLQHALIYQSKNTKKYKVIGFVGFVSIHLKKIT
jgi:hypothetical protein